jgi:hypothetical protein
MRRKAPWLAVLTGIFLVWIAADLWMPRRSDLRRFDPAEVAHLETAMWRSYYDRDRFHLFTDLTELLRTQYHLPFLRSWLAAGHAVRAAFVFKRGTNREDYERALPDLERFYAAILRAGNTPFDVRRTAALELEWWIVHRERNRTGPLALERALGELQAEIYRLPPERFSEHARLRAEAMAIRDRQASAGGVTSADWKRIEALLVDSWTALSSAVRPSG